MGETEQLTGVSDGEMQVLRQESRSLGGRRLRPFRFVMCLPTRCLRTGQHTSDRRRKANILFELECIDVVHEERQRLADAFPRLANAPALRVAALDAGN
jgi:hypothetical protein